MSLHFPGKFGSDFLIMHGWFSILLLVSGFLTAPLSLFAQSHLHDGAIPLMNAAMEGSIEQAEQLLQEGADLEERDDFGWTPLQVPLTEGLGEKRIPLTPDSRLHFYRLRVE
jgi:hypothetical protein